MPLPAGQQPQEWPDEQLCWLRFGLAWWPGRCQSALLDRHQGLALPPLPNHRTLAVKLHSSPVAALDWAKLTVTVLLLLWEQRYWDQQHWE